MHDDASLSERALRIVDDTWTEFATSPAIAPQLRRAVDRLPDLGPENAARRARLGRSLLERIEAVDAARLPVDLRLSLGVARHSAAAWAREEEWYWLLFDPLGIGFYALFAPTAYAGAFLLTTIGEIFTTFEFTTEGDSYRYVALLHDYARVVRQMNERTVGQALRGIVMPSPKLAGSIALVRSLRDSVPPSLRARPSLFCDPAMDAAQKVALESYRRPRRKAAYARVQGILEREVPQDFLWWPKQIEAINPDLHGFDPNPSSKRGTLGRGRSRSNALIRGRL